MLAANLETFSQTIPSRGEVEQNTKERRMKLTQVFTISVMVFAATILSEGHRTQKHETREILPHSSRGVGGRSELGPAFD